MYTEPLLGGDRADDGRAKQRHLQAEKDAGGDGEDAAVPLSVVIHQLNSFYAVLWPVATAMILTR